ncbi:hypothetical protein BCR37DRAFT_379146 [Protomyces lactucae-debilis]|uniref:DUF1275 domain protein n=1 Tax=Protomyces lactucae-debilis TaxID=2754530 RepID=A0A1Y2FGV1_PROLT|nr:uncharacterized protein BCR37DRAFT_379146 [Protomyces lactucae-debilis]ORY83159.1 hypothetical protein BCR37DRAFT_379146 [Protomyces lactucae-debilis]
MGSISPGSSAAHAILVPEVESHMLKRSVTAASGAPPIHTLEWLPFYRRPFGEYICDTLPSNLLVFHLVATGFITGILDATTFVEFGTFTSNQTGNTVLLGVLALGLGDQQYKNRLVDTAVSLSSFLIAAFICGQIANHIHPGHGRARWWILMSSFYQTATILITAGLLFGKAITTGRQWSWLVILLLASSSGSQVAMARQFSIPEIPTAMLTSPLVDLVTDPHLFSTSFHKAHDNPRSRRVSYIVALVVGVFLGAGIHKHAGPEVVILIAGCMKLVILLSFLVTASEAEHEERARAEREQVEATVQAASP